MLVLLAATLVEHVAGTIVMMVTFVGLAAVAYSIAARADLARPLLGILAFRLSAQLAMTLGTGSLLLTTMLSDTPACASDRLRSSGWRAPVIAILKHAIPRQWLRRIVGVEPPYGPPFLRVLAAVVSREWLGWVPTLGAPSLLMLPGTITFRPDRVVEAPARSLLERGVLDSIMPGGEELSGVYTYACKDSRHGDFFYIFRYQAFWMRPASAALLHSVLSLVVKMLLMHMYASLFMLLSQLNVREAFSAELHRRLDRVRRWLRPRPPVKTIPIEPGDICAFCHEELSSPPPEENEEEHAAALERWTVHGDVLGLETSEAGSGPRSASPTADAAAPPPSTIDLGRYALHCRWGCGKAVHKACAASWGRNACVYCSAPMT